MGTSQHRRCHPARLLINPTSPQQAFVSKFQCMCGCGNGCCQQAILQASMLQKLSVAHAAWINRPNIIVSCSIKLWARMDVRRMLASPFEISVLLESLLYGVFKISLRRPNRQSTSWPWLGTHPVLVAKIRAFRVYRNPECMSWSPSPSGFGYALAKPWVALSNFSNYRFASFHWPSAGRADWHLMKFYICVALIKVPKGLTSLGFTSTV